MNEAVRSTKTPTNNTKNENLHNIKCIISEHSTNLYFIEYFILFYSNDQCVFAIIANKIFEGGLTIKPSQIKLLPQTENTKNQYV